MCLENINSRERERVSAGYVVANVLFRKSIENLKLILFYIYIWFTILMTMYIFVCVCGLDRFFCCCRKLYLIFRFMAKKKALR